MENKQTNVGSFATAKLQAKRRSLLAIALMVVTGLAMTTCIVTAIDKDYDHFDDLSMLTGTWKGRYNVKDDKGKERKIDTSAVFGEVKSDAINMKLWVTKTEMGGSGGGGGGTTGSYFWDTLLGLPGVERTKGEPGYTGGYKGGIVIQTEQAATWERVYTLDEINTLGWRYTTFKKEIELEMGSIIPAGDCDCEDCSFSHPCHEYSNNCPEPSCGAIAQGEAVMIRLKKQ